MGDFCFAGVEGQPEGMPYGKLEESGGLCVGGKQQQKKVMSIPENTEFPEVLAERGMV